MGIWYTGSIDGQKNVSAFDAMLIPKANSGFIDLDQCGRKLGLLSVPHSTDILYPAELAEEINVAVDGVIYNKESLCASLHLEADADLGKVIISLYKKYGYEGFYYLDGAFALILIDINQQNILLYRSVLTGNSLFYTLKNNLLTISTNPMDLLHRSDVDDSLDMEQMSVWFSLEPYLWNDTVFSDMHEVEDGEVISISSKELVSRKKDLEKILVPNTYQNEFEVIERYRHLVENSIEKNIVTNAKYGIMLSSGMDSSTLAYFASKSLKEKGEALHAYSWSFPNYKVADETDKIKELCKVLEIDNTFIDAENYMPFSSLDSMILQPEYPFSNLFSPMISQLYNEASKSGVQYLLNGHYGDDIFPGIENLFVNILKDKRFELLIPTLNEIIKDRGLRYALKHSIAIRGFIKQLVPFYKYKRRFLSTPEWLTDEIKEYRKKIYHDRKNEEKKTGYEQFSLALAKMSVNSGGSRYFSSRFGIERLEPYRDIKLLNYTKRVPAYMSYKNGQMKYYAREAMRGLLPESILRQKRVGLLNKFTRDGFIANKMNVRERLFDEPDSWKVYVDQKWMEGRFEKNAELADKDLLIIWMSLNIGAWQKAIKPGGSLYEGSFMKESIKGIQK